MAILASDIPNIENRISGLQDEADSYQNKLTASPTAFSSATPSYTDISNQESFQRINNEIKKLSDDRLRAKWYPVKAQNGSTVQEGEAKAPKSVFGKGLDYLTRPLYGVVGAVKHVSGQGTDSLQKDVADNILRNKDTFGDVLSKTGLPTAVSAPLGFALDIGMDPVNWATMGGGALVPKLAIGAARGFKTGEGVVKGIGVAAKAGALESASTIGRYTPYFRKTEAFSNLSKASNTATDAYEVLTDSRASDIINKTTLRSRITDSALRSLEKTPWGQSFIDNFVYDPKEWVRLARMKDVIESAAGTGIDTSVIARAHVAGEDTSNLWQEAMAKMDKRDIETPVSINMNEADNLMSRKEVDQNVSILDSLGLSKKMEDEAPIFVKGVDDVTSINKEPSIGRSVDSFDSALKLAAEKLDVPSITLEDITKIYNSGAMDKTGVKWYDNMMENIKKYQAKIDPETGKIVSKGKTVLDSYSKAMSIFKVAKVAASPSSWVNSVAGNLIMAHMSGLNIGPKMMGRVKQSFDAYRGKSGKLALLDSLLTDHDNGSIARGLYENKTAAKANFGGVMTGISNPLTGKKGASYYTNDLMLDRAKKAGIVSPDLKVEDIEADMKSAMDEIMKKHSETSSGLKITKEKIKEVGGVENVSRNEVGTGMGSQELLNNQAAVELFEKIAQNAKDNPNNIAYKLLDFTFNKMPEGYENIDASYKFGTFLYTTVDGISMNELRRISKLVDINPEELTSHIVDGEKRYRLPARSAIDLTSLMYLNYAAMPGAVRVLRNMPIVGSPFISFMYGMSVKTAQTVVDNPAAFNKITYALNEFGGEKTPLEKKAINDPNGYYSYLKQDGMYRLPTKFFDENPMYLNLANIIPYYSLNMFAPSKTEYGDSVREQLASHIQNSPLLKDPVGSVLFDYLILPTILGDVAAPQGQFGQPLYPVDATTLEKGGYAARTLGEAFVPNLYNYAGLVTPEAVAEYVPSYRWRQLAMAKEGKNQLGISSKEPATSRTLRTLLQATGVPLQTPVNTTFTNKKQ